MATRAAGIVPADGDVAALADGARRRPQGMWFRLLLFVLSAGGVLVAVGLWVAGHGWLGARLLAGDVLLMFVLLLLAR